MDDRSIVADKLTRVFGQQTAVDSVDLDVPSGKVFGFLGPNGAGKSTVVRMLATILVPTGGRATVAGYDVGQQSAEVRMRIGVALQEVGLDPLMTARETLLLQARLFGYSTAEGIARGEKLLRTVGLDDVSPKKRVGQYSGGMKRRLDLALALVHDPKVLFLDEPTSGLDPVSRTGIWEEVRRLNRELGVTIFLTTQYLEEADRLADEIAIINSARIVARGTPEMLKREIGNEVVTLSFEGAEVAERAAAALASFTDRRQVSGSELLCYFAHAAPIIPGLVRALDEAGITLGGLTLTKPTLDDVFLRATGQRFKSEEPVQQKVGGKQ